MAQLQSFKAPICVQQFKLHIAIDFGTDGLGLAYSYADKIYVHSKWNSEKYQDVVKPKTIILLDEHGIANQFGLDAKDVYMKLGSKKNEWLLFERFKMSLYDNHIKDEMNINENNGIDINNKIAASNGKMYCSEKVFISAFKHIAKESKRFLRKHKIRVKKEEIAWILTVPAIWNDKAKYKMNEWIIKAGLVDNKIPNQCKIVYEPDCASLAIQHEIKNAKLSTIDGNKENEGKIDDTMKINGNFCIGEKYILIDAGGGTVDIAAHEIVGEFGVKEVLSPSGGPWGSCYIDDQYIIKLEEIFGKETINVFKITFPNVFVEIIYNFEKAKAEFGFNETKSHNVRLPDKFIAFLEDKIEENDDVDDIEDIVAESVMGKSGLVSLDYEFLKFDNIAWESMFDHVMDPTIEHIKKLLNEAMLMRNCKYLCLVGGLSCSPYFQSKLKKLFGPISKYKLQLIIPQRPILSVVQGAAYFGITRNYIKARKLAKSYGIAVRRNMNNWLYNNIPLEHIQKYQYFDEIKQCWFVSNCCHILARKGQQILSHQVFFHQVEVSSNGGTFFILSSDLKHPKVQNDGEILASYDLNIINSFKINKYLPAIVEFHFYDTTIKACSYLKDNPNIKKEIVFKFEG